MKKTTIKLLTILIIKVMYMLCSQAHMFSFADRDDLSRATADLEAALKEEPK